MCQIYFAIFFNYLFNYLRVFAETHFRSLDVPRKGAQLFLKYNIFVAYHPLAFTAKYCIHKTAMVKKKPLSLSYSLCLTHTQALTHIDTYKRKFLE